VTKKRRRTRYFDRLRLRHVRCFKETDVPLDPQVTVVIGGNGSGKTTLVEAAAALTGGSDEPPTDFPLRRKTSNAEIALFDKGGQQPAAVWKLKGGTATLKRLPEERFLFAYGRYRRVFYPEDSEESPSDPSSDLDELVSRVGQRRTVTLYRPDNHLLRDMARYLAALHRGAESDPNLGVIFKRLNDSLAVLGQGISGIKMLKRDYGYVPRVIRSGFALEMRELSDGYQALLVIIFDLLLRYAYLFPFLVNPLEGEATVLIDEVDLHLHPRWQRTVITQLTELFPMTQFILTTHSPAVVQGAIDLGMKVVVLAEKGGAADARALRPGLMRDLRGAEIGAVLLEDELFGVESRYSPEYGKIEQRVTDMRSKIQAGTLTEEDEKEVFEDLNTLKMLVAKDEERRADGSFMSQLAGLRISLLKELAAELRAQRS
jgi:energy-coupling factor transporter ATP-binding protein EcfA2